MKKITLLAFLILSLGGCSLKQSNVTNSSTRSIDQTEAAESQNVQFNSENQENLNNFEEGTKITTIFTPNNFKVTKLVDNSEKRVLLFSKDNQKFYKSIFVKSTQFLKVVDLKNNETEIFNGSI
ncbi:hypothetical protein BCR24_16180 [Enterococcus ureilyticus]|uniref:Lipoprotein n=2 Tax=Enterococcus ureilyticus TaxID=1131292 RepID=A0A1E5HB18_9ENTE|nr:hypothetical protein [Enterococcus ureilyticus]MBO0447549.1 hypothetical protein [Enterococcus ureilyticus]OEG22124.1 hypothetical protein BCR24_16180 [Enterococcus ureilyticus]